MRLTPEAKARHARRQFDPFDAASRDYPAIRVGPDKDTRLHVFEMDGCWEVWLNTSVADFDGLCIGSGSTRDDAVRQAVAMLESATEELQTPWGGRKDVA